MNLFDETGANLGGGKQGFRVYDAQGHLVGGTGTGGVGPPGPPGTNGTNGADGVSISWLGTFATAPVSPTLNQAYRNSVDKIAYVWNGIAWKEMVEDGVDGADGTNGGTSYLKVASSSSRTIGTGSVVFGFTSPIVTPDSLGWDIGTRVRAISSANPANYMEGVITVITMALLPTRAVSVTVLIDAIGGSGTFSDFVLSVAGYPGGTGPAGSTGPAGPGVPTGGTAGQVLTKNSSVDFDDSWQTPASGADVLQVQVFS